MPKTKPRISINKLGEYCEANSLRRKNIVREAKDPKNYITTRYSDARNAIQEYLISNNNRRIIIKAIEDVKRKPNVTDFQKSDNKLTLEVLQLILDADYSMFKGYDFHEFKSKHSMTDIGGVDVSIFPDLIISKQVNSDIHIGAIKLHITKGGLNRDSQKIIAAILYDYVENYIVIKDQAPDFAMCFSLDIFKNQLESSPRSHKRIMQRVLVSCEEIVLWWDKL